MDTTRQWEFSRSFQNYGTMICLTCDLSLIEMLEIVHELDDYNSVVKSAFSMVI